MLLVATRVRRVFVCAHCNRGDNCSAICLQNLADPRILFGNIKMICDVGGSIKVKDVASHVPLTCRKLKKRW